MPRPVPEIVGILLIAGLAVWTGSYLILKPQRYKDDLASYEHPFYRYPRWSIRFLGVFIIAAAVCVSYLFLTTPK